MLKLRRVLIMAGGTGGHVFPGLAVAKCMQAQGVEVNWLGTRKGLEATLVPDAGIPIHFISISGVRGKGIKDLLLAPFRLTLAVWQAIRIIRQLQPDVVLGMGGFASGPGGIASWLLRCPLVVHEQNAKPGTTNKALARVASKVLEGFPNTFLNRHNTLTVGNPVRKEIIELLGPKLKNRKINPESLHLLVLGGSLGATAINQLLPQALAKLPENLRPNVYHQAGEKHHADTVAAYQHAGVKANVVPFIKTMDQAYAWADLVLCRAGALTVAELCAAGVGAILVPFPHAIDDHQTANATFMAKNDAALLIQQNALNADNLADILQEFVQSPSRFETMANAAYELRKIDATEKVLSVCEEVCQSDVTEKKVNNV
ncbi:MAG: undecaprenyldiphospho-muramoylpentapeptide beta-N-acetylglucosaminyltransferase [Gammaproteobacteria bacterium]